jgi:hypothetical protein
LVTKPIASRDRELLGGAGNNDLVAVRIEVRAIPGKGCRVSLSRVDYYGERAALNGFASDRRNEGVGAGLLDRGIGDLVRAILLILNVSVDDDRAIALVCQRRLYVRAALNALILKPIM